MPTASAKGSAYGELILPQTRVGTQVAPEFAVQPSQHCQHPNPRECHTAPQHTAQAALHECRNHQQRGADHVGRTVSPRRRQMLLPRDHDDLEHSRDQHQHEEHSEQHDVLGQLRIAEPHRDAILGHDQEAYASRARERERNHCVSDVWSGFVRLPRNEVIQALRHPELREPIQRAVNEKQLFVRAELCLVERANQEHGNDERRGKPDRAADNEEKRRLGNRVP